MELNATTKPGTPTATIGLLRHFRRNEDGSIIIFSLFMFVLILWFGGMAVDLMRFETTRAKLQGTLDRAVLAAADLDQTLPPADVVRDYFSKAGMINFLDGDPIVEQGLNYRKVTANAQAEMPLFFYDLPSVFIAPFSSDMTSLTVSGGSSAEERVSDVEVSLVLDVSTSMERNNRIQNLRPAAREFVTTVLANNTNAPQGLITISIVPYSAVVNPGTKISPFLNVNRAHHYSTCVLFDDYMFNSTALNLQTEYEHVAHFDPAWKTDAPDYEPIKYPWCYTDDNNAIVPHTTSETDLHTAIDALTPFGNTAIDMGMKWGVALLDPSTNSIISALAGQQGSGVPALASSRPMPFDEPDVLKVVVLMTDGQNTSQYDLHDEYKWNISPLWFNRDPDDPSLPPLALKDVPLNRTSVQIFGQTTESRWDDWFYLNGDYSGYPYAQYPNGFKDRGDYVYNGVQIAPFGTVGTGTWHNQFTFRAHWQDLYASRVHNLINVDYFSEVYYNTPYFSYNQYYGIGQAINFSLVNGYSANARLASICAAARDQDIIIYTVAFEAPHSGRTALQNCASSSSHYFDVSGTDISSAFAAIASDIRALKLTD